MNLARVAVVKNTRNAVVGDKPVKEAGDMLPPLSIAKVARACHSSSRLTPQQIGRAYHFTNNRCENIMRTAQGSEPRPVRHSQHTLYCSTSCKDTRSSKRKIPPFRAV